MEPRTINYNNFKNFFNKKVNKKLEPVGTIRKATKEELKNGLK